MVLEDAKVGALVFVSSRADEKMTSGFMGRRGWIDGFDRSDCGASEDDPMIFVRFPGGDRDGFWLEELDLVVRKDGE